MVTEKHAVRGKRASGSSSRLKIWVGAAIAALVVAGAVLGLGQQGIIRASGGTLTAESTSFDFGQVKMTGGLIRTRFPLTVQGNPLVTGMVTSWMCTLARLVQGATVSDWYSMPMQGNPQMPNPNMRLRSGEPAYLEVTIDPAAHGDAGLGPIQRSVLLQTDKGQRIQFDLTAAVVR